MELRQLHYFIAIAEEGSITAAAARLHLTQPPLSQQLKKLEEELNVVLFERDSRKVQLTDVGQLFLIRAKQILALSEATQSEISDYANGCQGTIFVGITPTAIPLILSPAIGEFHCKFPLINFEIFEGNTSYISELLTKGIVDIGILRSPFNTKGLNSIRKKSEPMVAAMSPSYNWSDALSCSVRELDKKKLIIYRRYEALLQESFAQYNAKPHIICKTERSYTALRAAESGLGIAVLPFSALQMAQDQLILKILEDPSLSTSPMAVWTPDRYLSKAAEAFLEYFKEL